MSGCPGSADELKTQLASIPRYIPRTLLVSSPAERISRKSLPPYRVHGGRLPPGSFIEVAPDWAVATPEFLFVEMARELELAHLVLLGCELCGTYSPYTYIGKQKVERNEPLTSIAAIEQYIAHAGTIRGAQPARRALKYVLEGSASVMETEMALRLSMPKRLGGYGIDKPVLNHKVPFNEHAKMMAHQTFARADLCWPEHLLDVEYDSDAHHSGSTDIAHDKERANGMGAMGYRVIFVSRSQYNNPAAFDSIAREISKAVGHKLREYPTDPGYRRFDLQDAFERAKGLPVFNSTLPEKTATNQAQLIEPRPRAHKSPARY